MATLEFLTYLTIVLFVGLFSSMISAKLRIPNVLLLILAGMGLGHLTYLGKPVIEFPDLFLTVIGVFALIIIVFDSTSRLKLSEFDKFSFQAINLVLVFLISTLAILTFSTIIVVKIHIFYALIFSSIVVGTSSDFILYVLSGVKNKVIEFLKLESIINTPLIVLLPFIIIDFMSSIEIDAVFSKFLEQIIPFLQQIITGVGAGIVIGLIIFKFMRKGYSEQFSPIAIIAASLITYILAENLGGNGVLAVSVAGLMFGNVYLRQKTTIQSYSSFLSNFLEILVFVLIGFIIKIPFTLEFLINSALLYLIYSIVRFLSLSVVLKDTNVKERVFMTLNAPKGIAVAVLVLTLSTLALPNLKLMLDLVLAFMLYSIIISTITLKFSKYFIKIEAIPAEKPKKK